MFWRVRRTVYGPLNALKGESGAEDPFGRGLGLALLGDQNPGRDVGGEAEPSEEEGHDEGQTDQPDVDSGAVGERCRHSGDHASVAGTGKTCLVAHDTILGHLLPESLWVKAPLRPRGAQGSDEELDIGVGRVVEERGGAGDVTAGE